MNFQEFTKHVLGEITQRVNGACKVEIQKVKKNNDVVLHGLTFFTDQTNFAPTIYLEGYYEMHRHQISMEQIVDHIWKMYQDSLPDADIDMSFLCNFESVKDRVVYRLIHAERNKELLEETPHILIWDLAICFYYDFWSEKLGEGMIRIHNSLMESWDVDCQTLMHLAQDNTPKLIPMTFLSMHEVLRQLDPEYELSDSMQEDLYVLSNQQKVFGATSILYPGVLEEVAQVLQSDFYVLPSSVHEVLILKKERYDVMKRDGVILHEMIQSINEQQLSAEDVLSDYPYFYNYADGKLIQLVE